MRILAANILLLSLVAFAFQSCKVKQLDGTVKTEEVKKPTKQESLKIQEEVEELPAEAPDLDYAMPADCYSEEIANANQRDCGKVVSQVCGCNGKTYINECEARKAGIVKITQGKCP